MMYECLHGHAAIGGTSFPQPIGLAATSPVTTMPA